ncbi:hypothetical protein ACHQM5_020700 [Ranunculus cassubicifolius]
MSSLPIHVKEAVLISPSDTTPTHILPLSTLDSQPFLRFTIEYLLLYRSPITDRSATTARMKDALSQALVPYYPFAGRVRPRLSDSKHLEVVCRSQGALFIEAILDGEQVSISDLQKAPRCTNQWRNLLTFHVNDVLCAAAIGVGINHVITDGIGSAEFLNTFAELASGKNLRKPSPIWDRYLLDPTPKNPSFFSHPEFESVQDFSGFVSRFNEETLTPTSVVFNSSSLTELKKLANELSELFSFTAFEVLSAHVWRSWAKSLKLSPQQILRLLFSVNIRNQVRPSLPAGFYGNGFLLGCAQTTVEELTTKDLGYAADLVRKAKERIGDEYVRSVIKSVSETSACPDAVGVLIVSQWSRLGLDGVDFGMGKPVHVGPVCTDRYCLFLPVVDQQDAVKVMVAVPRSAVAEFEYLLSNHPF